MGARGQRFYLLRTRFADADDGPFTDEALARSSLANEPGALSVGLSSSWSPCIRPPQAPLTTPG
jgi:hypothetical protein